LKAQESENRRLELIRIEIEEQQLRKEEKLARKMLEFALVNFKLLI
jgi:hypothetical protein